MLRISWVAAQLAASQEGLSSMSDDEWINFALKNGENGSSTIVIVIFTCSQQMARTNQNEIN
jgi:hypothetical protein